MARVANVDLPAHIADVTFDLFRRIPLLERTISLILKRDESVVEFLISHNGEIVKRKHIFRIYLSF